MAYPETILDPCNLVEYEALSEVERRVWGRTPTASPAWAPATPRKSGKRATCRMVAPIHIGAEAQSNVLTPGEAYGRTFVMQVRGESLVGSYPYIGSQQDSTRLGTFRPTRLGASYYATDSMFGH